MLVQKAWHCMCRGRLWGRHDRARWDRQMPTQHSVGPLTCPYAAVGCACAPLPLCNCSCTCWCGWRACCGAAAAAAAASWPPARAGGCTAAAAATFDARRAKLLLLCLLLGVLLRVVASPVPLPRSSRAWEHSRQQVVRQLRGAGADVATAAQRWRSSALAPLAMVHVGWTRAGGVRGGDGAGGGVVRTFMATLAPPPPHVSHTPWGGVIGVSKKQLHVIGLPDCACAIQPLLTLSTPPHTRPRTRLDQPFHCCCLLPAWATPKPDRSPIKCVDGVTCVCIGAPAATTLGLGALLPECPFWALSALPEGLAGRPGARDCQQPAGARLPADCMRPRSTSSDHNDTTPPRPLCCGACAPPHSHPPPP